jgi:hypothetical protein
VISKLTRKAQKRVIKIEKQFLVMRFATGETSKGLEKESQRRRQANWLPWYQESDTTKESEHSDLPVLAIQFREFWNVKISRRTNKAESLLEFSLVLEKKRERRTS